MKITLTSEQLRQAIDMRDYLQMRLKNYKLDDLEKLLMLQELDKLNKCIETGVVNIN